MNSADMQPYILRAAGVALLLIFLVTFDPNDPSLLNRLGILGLGAIGAWLALQSLFALALTAALLAGIHSEPGHPDPLRAWLYPVIAVISAGLLLWLLGHRFAAHIQATRQARWAARQQSPELGEQPGGQRGDRHADQQPSQPPDEPDDRR